MSIEHIQPGGLFQAEGMSHVVIGEGRMAFIAGQGSYDENFQLVGPGDYRAQTLQAFRNLTLALAAAGAGPEQVVSSTMYVVGLDAAVTEIFVEAMSEALDGHPFPPHASSLVGVAQLAYPEMLVEISAIAVLG